MRDARAQTVIVSVAAVNANPTVLHTASTVPVRVLVENVGPLTIFLGYAHQDVIASDGLPSTSCYRLLPDRERTFVLAPKQVLLASSVGGLGLATVNASDAIPVV